MRNPCPHCGSRTGFKEFDTTTYCFKCHKWTSKGVTGLYKESKKQISLITPIVDEVVYNIDRFSTEALKWLYKYFIFQDDITKYKIGYIPANERLYFPFYENEKLVYYITRALIPGDIKYKAASGVTPPLVIIKCPNTKYRNRVVLVEDYISAIRVSKYCDTIFVQGTGVSKQLLEFTYNNYTCITTWFDGDAAGDGARYNFERGFRKYETANIENRLYMMEDSLQNKIITHIVTDCDPKTYTDTVILNKLDL